MICRLPFVTKKSQRPRQAQHKTRKPAMQTSGKAVGKMHDDERGGCRPMTVFPEFATPADDASYIVRESHVPDAGHFATKV